MNTSNLIFRLFCIHNLPKLVVLTPRHYPCMPFVDCVNTFAYYAHTFDDYTNTFLDLANALDTPTLDFLYSRFLSSTIITQRLFHRLKK
jgi:hypothetical protein